MLISVNSNWNPSDPTQPHLAPDFRTLVQYMHRQSPIEFKGNYVERLGREFVAFVCEAIAPTRNIRHYFLLLPRTGFTQCEASFPDAYIPGIRLTISGSIVNCRVILMVHTHNSCEQTYEGFTYDDYTAGRWYSKIPILVIGRTEISYLETNKIPKLYNADFGLIEGDSLKSELQKKGSKNPFKVADTLSWIIYPHFNFKCNFNFLISYPPSKFKVKGVQGGEYVP